jgi:hypothetical protein
MAFCPHCEQLKDSLCFDKPREYLELARQLLNSVNEGALTVKECTCPLQDLFNPEWPSEEVEHNFECTACGRTYQLFADTFHGRAGWGLTGPPRPEPEPPPEPKSEVGFWMTAPSSSAQ